MKPQVAVIGSGIAGMASAYYLRDHFDVHLYESADYVGGHTNTKFVASGKGETPIDTGFMVFNDHTYPNLIKLFDELGVSSYPTSMSFGVRNVNTGLEYCSNGGSGFFAQRARILDPRQWSLYSGIKHFFSQAHRLLESDISPEITIGDFAQEYAISDRAMEDFVLPMAGAVWSTPPDKILDFPAKSMLGFMKNHHMLGIGIQYQWKTVKGGSEQYKRKLLNQLHRPPMVGCGVKSIHQSDTGSTVQLSDGTSKAFSHVIVATHADDALKLLSNPTELQGELLSRFGYNQNHTVLHTDESVMPKSRNAWASWNVSHEKRDGETLASTHYWMNNLQDIEPLGNHFVSVDPHQTIDPDKIVWSTHYTHPRFDTAAIEAQPRLKQLNEEGSLSFCGSYFRNGFHEDALWSALNAVELLLKRKEVRSEIAAV
ncbi:NAD(P)/FAD-dependent oxidoreductase [Pelagicoccus albus]|uniref:FAD-dependent oxidoreductase n=1 Tax=Pelagicoccus albus TaxID=415222 RepID=A0A7X1EBN1_9BACT|nr:FAD-dependent oxidoreductase [Pelagicoccus albus]MBC2607987.1 FAD-dependent oxidoreductase [Pelagicoccus albus]